MPLTLRSQSLAASSVVITPTNEWGSLLHELQSLVHTGDWWQQSDTEKPLTMADVKQLLHFAQQTPIESQKVAAILFADTLRLETANALLKILEEPPAYLSLVLFSESARLLPTVRSRVRLLTIASEGGTKKETDFRQWQDLLQERSEEMDQETREVKELLYLTPLLHSTVQQGLVREGFARHNKKQ